MFSLIFLFCSDYKEGQNCTVKYKKLLNNNVIGSYKFIKMDSFEINKIIAAVLLVALLIIGIGKISDVVFHVDKPEKPGYVVEVEQVSSSTDTTSMLVTTTEEKIDIAALMSMGDIAIGEKVFKKCAACHSIAKGGKNNIGPALYNVVGRNIGVAENYKYSKALVAYGADKQWTFEELNGYLTKPAKWIKNGKMAFAGLRKEKDRASVIMYLNQNSDNPLPLP